MPVFLTHTKPLILEKSEVGFYNHYHYDVEIKYVVDGNFRVVEEGVAYDLKKGDIWIGFPFIEHSFESDGENDVVLAIFSPDDTPQLAKTFCTTRPVCPVINVSALAPGFGGELVRMAQLWMSGYSDDNLVRINSHTLKLDAGFGGKKLSRGMILNYLTAMVGELLESLELKPTESSSVYSIQRIISFCAANIGDSELSMQKLSAEVGLSRSQIYRIMSQRMKISFPEFINSIRINQAREMLMYTDKSITTIAFECGFMSPRNFNRVFRDIIGQSPSEYRASPHGSTPDGVLL